MTQYLPRIVDAQLDEFLQGLPAVAVEGPKAVGKTATAQRRAVDVVALDDPELRRLVAADPTRIDRAGGTLLVDEWQRYPPVWDLVRRSVDHDGRPGRFLLTGSAAPAEAPVHSGAGRIVQVRMRPMSLAERGPDRPTVSLAALLAGTSGVIAGDATLDLPAYVEEILRSGFPGIRQLPPRLRRAQLDGYLARVVERDFAEQGHRVRRPATLRAWLAAYAAATASSASYNSVLDAATAGESDKPAKTTTIVYRDVLEQLWLLDPLPAWLPVDNPATRLAQAPKHHLADPALAARLLDLDESALLSAKPVGSAGLRRAMIGPLFESLVALSLRVYAQAAEARVHHLRTRNGDHEVDFVIVGPDGRILVLEAKVARTVDDRDVVHLHWLRSALGATVADAAVVTTGGHAYRRPDGIAVVPASLLGP
ncbi:ATP-binding protein [Jiangella alba]|uniref:ATP-binding protein n=1 Tax=Jiangella alba TaxID=561176 RepID=A0A1H5PXX0_9ACTN|nr:DUF4143 domain-containing protein [Jiangella alba]SEF18051.1 hypothetical protein SAMN04488561_6196 [Jiangella alba]